MTITSIVFLSSLIGLLIIGIVNLIHAFKTDRNKLLWGSIVILEIILIAIIIYWEL